MWLYNGLVINTIEDLPNHESLYGFIYCISNIKTGESYVGKKQFYSRKKKNLAKRDLSADKRKRTYIHIVKESDWKTYRSSSDRLKEDMAKLGEQSFLMEIVKLCHGEKSLTFCEIEEQIKANVLRVPSYNDNIMGRYYRKDMID